MKTKNRMLNCFGFVLFSAAFLMSQPWKLPQEASVKETGPRTYRFTEDYLTSDTQGRIIQTQQVKGDYTRGLPNNEAVWNNVSVAQSPQPGSPLGKPQERNFMDGFSYDHEASDPMSPEFFKGFPNNAVQERNLVWDVVMFEDFGQKHFQHLKLNQPYHLITDQEVNMPGVGKFHNKNIQLMWSGRSYRNGQDCALIEYNAYFNPLELHIEGMSLKGRSHYWGQIWVSLKTRQIEYATLYEDVLGEMKLPGSETVQIINAFRYGVFEPLTKR